MQIAEDKENAQTRIRNLAIQRENVASESSWDQFLKQCMVDSEKCKNIFRTLSNYVLIHLILAVLYRSLLPL